MMIPYRVEGVDGKGWASMRQKMGASSNHASSPFVLIDEPLSLQRRRRKIYIFSEGKSTDWKPAEKRRVISDARSRPSENAETWRISNDAAELFAERFH
jgi:hypothetical protein